MPSEPEFDTRAAHRYYSAYCFNQAWALIRKSGRTPEEDETMLRLSMASIWHWTQRADCTPENMSIGYWQVARIYALLGQVDNARRYGRLCLQAAQGDGIPLFCLGYAYEALARAEAAAGNRDSAHDYLAMARAVADGISDQDDRLQLLEDLATIA